MSENVKEVIADETVSLTAEELYKFTTGRDSNKTEGRDEDLHEIQLDLAERLERLLKGAQDAIDPDGYCDSDAPMRIAATTHCIHRFWVSKLYNLYMMAMVDTKTPRLRQISQYIETLLVPLAQIDETGKVIGKVSDQFATDLRDMDANIQDFLRDNEVLSKLEVS